MHRLRPIFILACLLCTGAATPGADPARAYLQSFVTARTNPAISAGIYAGGNVRFISAGTANVQFALPADEHTIYRIGSITKAFTGTVIQELMLQHAIVGGAGVDRYLGRRVNSAFRQPAIEELLQMRGGVAHGWYYSRRPDFSADAIDARFAAVTEPPGETFTYWNFSYGLLAAAASHETHLSYADLFQRYVFAPLSMSDSFVSPRGVAPRRFATPYASNMKPSSGVFLYPAGAAGAFSSASDLMSFALYNIGEMKARSPLTGAVSQNVHRATSFYANGWGQVQVKDGTPVWIADGESIGGCATVIAMPRQKIAVVVLTNVCHTGQSDTIATQLIGTLAPDIAKAVGAVFAGGGDPSGTPTPSPTPGRVTGTFKGYALVDERKIALQFTVGQDGAVMCSFSNSAGSFSKATASESAQLFDCSGPRQLQELSNRFGEIAARPIRWAASVHIESARAYGELRVQNADALPGFRLSFPIVALRAPSG